MHPKLLESTIAQCRAHIAAGDCHGPAPHSERLIEAVVQLADQLSFATLPQDHKAVPVAEVRRTMVLGQETTTISRNPVGYSLPAGTLLYAYGVKGLDRG